MVCEMGAAQLSAQRGFSSHLERVDPVALLVLIVHQVHGGSFTDKRLLSAGPMAVRWLAAV